MLGSKTFVEEIKEKFDIGKQPHLEKPQERDLIFLTPMDPLHIIDCAAKMYQINPDTLIQSRYGKNVGEARQATIYLLRNICHLPLSKIGEILGGIGDSAVSYSFEKGRRLRSKKFKSLVERFQTEAKGTVFENWRLEI